MEEVREPTNKDEILRSCEKGFRRGKDEIMRSRNNSTISALELRFEIKFFTRAVRHFVQPYQDFSSTELQKLITRHFF